MEIERKKITEIPERSYVAGFRPHCEEHCGKTFDNIRIIREGTSCTNHDLPNNFWEDCWECYIGSK